MDKVFIEDLEIETIIGIFGWEREVKQIVKINVEMDFDNKSAGRSDNINDALNYKSIGKSIINMVENSSFYLVEKMAEEIAKLVLKNKNIAELRLRVEKPGALRGSKSVGVEILRCQK